jgi:hypothetical protein
MATATDGFELQDRDLEILRALFESRVMTASHIALIYFKGSGEAVKQRLQKLKKVGLIGERKRRVNELSLLFLTPKAIETLRKHGKLADYPHISSSSMGKRVSVSDLTLNHELEIMDVKASLYAGIRNAAGVSLTEFSTWPLLYQFEVSHSMLGVPPKTVRPDGFIRIREKESADTCWEHTFFFELDRSEEIQNKLITKARYYLEYYKSGGFAERNGAPRSEPETFPFRVLMVVQTAERRNNTAEGLLRSIPPIYDHVWLTTISEVKANPLGPIWICPDSYLKVTKDTLFDPALRQQTKSYRRQTERELFVENTILKFPLLALPQ